LCGTDTEIPKRRSSNGAAIIGTDPAVSYTWGYGLTGDAAAYARLEKITLPGGRQIYYNYEDANAFMSLGRVANIAANGSPDDANTYVAYKYLGASTVVDANHPAVPAGLRLTLDPNADKAYAGFDGLGRVIDQRWATTGSAADRFGYTYDRASNRLTKALPIKTAFNETYGYDHLDRLRDANRPGDSGMGQLDQSWTLRPTGNWSSFTSAGVQQTRTHNLANEILTITRDPIDPPDPLYDPAGSNVFGPKPNDDANGMHCRYDAWNRLATVHLDDGDTAGTLNGTNTLLATYRYDGLNRRVKKVVAVDGNSVADYVYHNEGWQVVEVRRGVNAAPTPAAYKQYAWDLRYIDAPICRWWDSDRDGQIEPAAGEMQYFTNDGNFNTTALIDANSGAVVERYQYDPYGKVTVLNGAAGAEKDPSVSEWTPDADNKSDWDNDILYCGYSYDPVTGLYHVRERYYDPITGTWKTRDRILYPDGMNLYEYGISSPALRRDPFGLEIKEHKFLFYTITRDTTKTRATVCAHANVPSSYLAGAIKLSRSDVNKWLIDATTGNPAGETLEVGKEYTIPNLLILQMGSLSYSAKDIALRVISLPALWKSLVGKAQELSSKEGYMIVTQNVSKTAEVLAALGNADLQGYGFAGHGTGEGELWIGESPYDINKGSANETLNSGLYVHHKIQYMWLLACNSLEPTKAPQSEARKWVIVKGLEPPSPLPKSVRRVNQWSQNISEFGFVGGFVGAPGAAEFRFGKALTFVEGTIMPGPEQNTSQPATQPNTSHPSTQGQDATGKVTVP